MWKDSPPLTAYFLRRPDPQDRTGLPGSQHFSAFPALSCTVRGSSQNSQERRTLLDDLIPAEETQSWGVSLLPEARAPKPLQSETGPEFGGGGGVAQDLLCFLWERERKPRGVCFICEAASSLPS